MTRYENDDCGPCGEVDCAFCGSLKDIVARSLEHQRRIRRLEKLLREAAEALELESILVRDKRKLISRIERALKKK